MKSSRMRAQTDNAKTAPKLLVAMTGKAIPARAAEGDKPVFAYIASLPQPQRAVAERIDALAAKTLPDLQRCRRGASAAPCAVQPTERGVPSLSGARGFEDAEVVRGKTLMTETRRSRGVATHEDHDHLAGPDRSVFDRTLGRLFVPTRDAFHTRVAHLV